MAGILQRRLAFSPLLVLAAALSAGILVEHFSTPSRNILFILISVDVCLLITCVALILRKEIPCAAALLIVAFLIGGIVLASVSNRVTAANRISRMDEAGLTAADPIELTGTIGGQPEPAPQSFRLTLRAESIRLRGIERKVSGSVLLLAHVPTPGLQREYDQLELRHGARIRVMTTLDRDEGYRNPGVMPFTEYLEREGYDATGVIKSPLLVERLDDERVFLPLAWLYQWREHLQQKFARLFSPETAGVLNAALLGNQYNISGGAAERFRAGGTFHVLVISGFQIAFIGGLMLVLVRYFTKRRALQFLFASVLLWSYTIAVGADASVVRSAVMFTIIALAPVTTRRANTLNSLGAAAIALLVWHPSDLFNPSFQLTFLSVLSIVSIAVPFLTRMQQIGAWRPTHETPYPPVCERWFRSLSEMLFWSERAWKAEMASSNVRYKLFKNQWAVRLELWHVQKVLRFAMAAAVVSAGVQAGMLPLLIIYFHRISFASLLLNIFVGIAMAALALVGLAAVLIAEISPWAASPLVWLAEKTEWLMVHGVDPFSRFGVASMRLPHYHGWQAGIYLAYFLLLGFLVFALARWNPLRPPSITRIGRKPFRPRQVRIAAVAFVTVLLLVIIHPFSAARPDGKLHVDYLDVGQGDCALVTMPDGTTLLIDGGGRPSVDWKRSDDAEGEGTFERDTRSIGERVVSEFLWARGLDHVDYLLPTHADADHIDGLNDIARNFHVRGAIVARTPRSDPEYARFAATMKDAGVPIQQVGAGDVLRVGEVSAEVVWPAPLAGANAPYGNNDGLVLRLRYGERTFLFAADIEAPAETALVKQRPDLRSDIVKVAHHGSRTSSTAAFVAATNPGLAIISVGRTSIFGHPNKEVVERWRASGANLMTTGERGAITIETDGRSLGLQTFVDR